MVFPNQLDNNGVPIPGQGHPGQQQQVQGQAPGQAQAQAQAQLGQGPMQAQNFHAYMKQERDLREESDKRHADARREDKERNRAEAQIKRVSPCTGTTPQSVREWIQEVDLTIHYSNQTVYIASQTAKDALRKELEFYLNAQPNRDNVTWTQSWNLSYWLYRMFFLAGTCVVIHLHSKIVQIFKQAIYMNQLISG